VTFPSCQFTSKYYNPNFNPMKNVKVFRPRPWQKELTSYSMEAGRYLQVHAPGGCGKTTWAAYNSVIESIHTKNSRKFLFMAPMTTICDSFAKPVQFTYEGKNIEWDVLYRYGSDPQFQNIRELKKFLSLSVDQKHPMYSAAVTHQGWIHFWGDLKKEEKKKFLQNITIYIDECHHCTEEKTKLGLFLTDVLKLNVSTCKLILMTATMFRGDENDIIPKRYQSRFKSWLLQFEEYMEILQIKEFNFDYIGYDDDPLDLIEGVIRKHRDKKHVIVLPDTGQRFRKDETTFYKYMGRLLTLFHSDRILDLITESKQKHNKEMLKDHPEKFDVIIFASEDPNMIKTGKPDPKSRYARYYTEGPPEYEGGIGKQGVEALKNFVSEGGILVTLNDACGLVIDEFNPPVTNTLEDVSRDKFFCPTSILKLNVNRRSPIGYGLSQETAAVFSRSKAFQTSIPDMEWDRTVVANYPKKDILISGWLLGEETISRKAAVVDVTHKKGHIIMIGVRCQHRAQSHGTYKFLLNAMLYPEID